MTFCSIAGLHPGDVDDQVVDQFREALKVSGDMKRPDQHVRQTIRTWNRLAERADWPKIILAGLVKCAACGGNYSPSGRHYLSCSSARRKGTCENRRGIPRTVLEGLVIDTLKQHLMAPELVKEFIQAYHAELNNLRAKQEVGWESDRRELADLNPRPDYRTGLMP
jgi:hypothetical protein